MGDGLRDFGLAIRGVARRPALSAVIVATLALGIGATTAMFSFVHGVLLAPLAFPDSGRLLAVCEVSPDLDTDWCGASPFNVADWEAQSRTIESFGLARNWTFRVQGREGSEPVVGGVATAGLFDVFAVRPVLGRTLVPADTEAGQPPVALVSESFWRRRLGGEPAAVGRPLVVDGEARALVGVVPDSFRPPELKAVDVWIPLWPPEPGRADYRWWRGFHPFGRLAPGSELAAARTEMETIRARLAAEYPATNEGWGLRVDGLRDHVVREVRPALLAFLGAVGCVLLIACVNVAHLMLVRATARAREFAVRAALGAGRLRLFRQLIAEGLVYAVLGGAGGVALAYWIVEGFVRLAPADFPRLEGVSVDGGVLGFAAGVSVATTLVFGLAPALHAARLDLVTALKDGRGGTARREAARLRDALAVGETALALCLLVAAGLLVRSFAGLLDWSPGFDRSRLVTVQVFTAPEKYPDQADAARLYDQAVEELAGLPGVDAATAASAGPLFGGDGAQELFVEGRPVPPDGQRPRANWYDVAPSYFGTLGIPLLRGRAFDERDGPGAPRVAIVNDALARRLWLGGEPLGQRVRLVAHETTVEVVGVVADTQPFRRDRAPEPEIYWPYAQAPRWAIHLVLRTSAPLEAVTAAARARLARLDPDLDVGRFVTMDEHVEGELVAPRFNMALFVLFAAVAAVIAGVGLFGVVSFAVAERTREIGLRVALGATRRDVFGWVLVRGTRLAAAGIGLGLLGAVAATRLISSLLVAVTPTDPATLASAAGLLALVVLAACVEPARRAVSVDPAIALRQE